MRILWVANQPVPKIAKCANQEVGMGGGWLNQLSEQLSSQNVLGIIFPNENGEYRKYCVDNLEGYSIPSKKSSLRPNGDTVNYIIMAIKDFQPDMVHIWGTEYVHSYCAVEAAKECGLIAKTVISIQGMVSVYAKHFFAYKSKIELCFPTLYDLKNRCGLISQHHAFMERGIYEIKAIENVQHIIGRTDWDEACTSQINPQSKYHFCNETLRPSFYNAKWDIKKCERHSIFVSQSQYPIKGFHLMLEAMPLILKKWPNCKLYTTGINRSGDSLKEKFRVRDYDLYLRKLVKKLHLEEHVFFLGPLNEKEMCQRFLKSHVFVSPSSIENSPNSVGEAMLLGMPVVASDVGGVKNMLTHNLEGYVYQPDASYMIAYYVGKFFEDDSLCAKMGERAKQHALVTHDIDHNYNQLMHIYKEICQMDCLY